MQTIKLHVDDNKLETLLNIITNLKSTLISSYEVTQDVNEDLEFRKLSDATLKEIWNNKEDSIYDKFL